MAPIMRSPPRSTRRGSFWAARKEHEPVHRQPSGGGTACRMSADRFTSRQLAEGEALFSRPWHFVKGVPNLSALPAAERTEICVAGRSNVGKSSLINRLV